MTEQEIIDATSAFVKEQLDDAEAGHDWWHTYRVWQNAKAILAHEKAGGLVVELAALLHDIADSKFHDGDEEIGPRIAGDFLAGMPVPDSVAEHVVAIIRHMSFKGGHESAAFSSPEMAIVQDADRLDAIGAIGIARAFHYGGYKNRKMYDPAIPPNLHMSREQYKKSDAPTLNHFYEKLLLLKDRMNTDSGKAMASQRHEVLEQFLAQFLAEWEGQR